MRDLQPCGTWAASRRHRRRKEPLDDACRDAENARYRERYAKSPVSGDTHRAHINRKNAEARAVNPVFLPKPCEHCGAEFVPTSRRQRRCMIGDCATKRPKRPMTERDAAHYARRNAQRRMLVDVGDADLSWRTVGQRDGWTCWLCLLPVDPDHVWVWGPGTSNHEHGSLDHVIPLSLGGAHTPENARLAHLGCNIRRGNRVTA